MVDRGLGWLSDFRIGLVRTGLCDDKRELCASNNVVILSLSVQITGEENNYPDEWIFISGNARRSDKRYFIEYCPKKFQWNVIFVFVSLARISRKTEQNVMFFFFAFYSFACQLDDSILADSHLLTVK